MSREDSQFKLRMPAELREKIEDLAREAKRSLNAEIIARLEASVFKEAPGRTLPSAKKAMELAALARRDLADSVRHEIIEDISIAISKGMGVCHVDLKDYDMEGMSNLEFQEVVSNIETDLINAGYYFEWDGQETLSIYFNDDR